MKNNLSTLEVVLESLMKRYSERVPDVKKISRAMISEGIIAHENEIENDHVAFRTMGVEHLGIRSFEKIFLSLGYRKMDYFYFEGKKLDAYWFAPPQPHFPRIFVSELRVNDLSESAQNIIRSYTDEVQSDPVDHLDLKDGEAIDHFLHTPL